MLIFSGCARVAKSYYVDHQQMLPNWAAFVEAFKADDTFEDAENKDDLPLFMAAEYAHSGVRRCAANVLRVHFLPLDMDVGDTERQLQAIDKISAYGHIVYTTFSHDPGGQTKFRALVKLSRPVEVSEWAAFFPRAVHHFGLSEKDPKTGKRLADMKCADPCHMFYVPGGDREKYHAEAADGPALDVAEVLASDLPAGLQEMELPNYQEVLEEEDRGEVTELLRDAWNAKLDDLCTRIRKAPYPGSLYELKSHGVYGVARGIPHIISEDRVRNMVRKALDARYRPHEQSDAAVEGYRQKSYEQVDIAIGEGMGSPWYPMRVDQIGTFPLTEYGLAERLLDQSSEDLSYEASWRNWLVWTGAFWNLEAGEALVQERMKAAVRAIREEGDAHLHDRWVARQAFKRVENDPNVDDETKAQLEAEKERIEKLVEGLYTFADKAQTRSKTSAGVGLASSDPKVLVSNDLFNRDPYLLNFRNGIVDLRTGKLSPHRREAYITRIVPYDFRPGAECPQWDKFLLECMEGNRDMVQFLWRLIGYTSIGITSEQIMPMLIGEGANGKSTFLGTLLKMFGTGEKGFGLAVQSENLLTKAGGNQHATWRMSMFGKRLVTVQEVEEGRAFNESLIKEITGSDMITGRKMRQDEWSYIPNFTPWFAANHLPHVRGIDEGIWRRLLVITWGASFRGRADKSLPQKLEREIPGIWARAAREAVHYLDQGLQVPSEVVAATEDYRTEQDPLKPFFDARCLVKAEEWVSREALWSAYVIYTEDARERVFHERKRFFGAIRKRFPELKRNGKRGFSGIRTLTGKERQERSPQAILRKENDDLPN